MTKYAALSALALMACHSDPPGWNIQWLSNGTFLSSATNESPGVASARCVH